MAPKLGSETRMAIKEAVKELVNDDQFLEALYKKVEEKLSKLEQKVDSLEQHINKLEDIIENMQQNEKQKNLCIFGVTEERNERLNEKLIELFKSKMAIDLDKSEIVKCYRLGSNTRKIRPVVVKFERQNIRNHIYDNCKRLKGTTLAISEDLTKNKLRLLNEVKNKVDKKSVRTFNGKIYVYMDGKKYLINGIEDMNEIA